MRPTTARRWLDLPAAAVLVGALLMGALSGCAEDPPAAAPEPSPTPLANLNTASMQIPRIDFCKLVQPEAVRDALAGKPDDAAAYGNGDVEPLSGVPDEVLHEIGCAWRTSSGATARAWVFARPMTPESAQPVIAAGTATKGCRQTPGPAFGRPTYTQQCSFDGGEQRVRHAGLFGQTWLTCEVTAPSGTTQGEVGSRAGAWCVEVASALNTAR